MVKEHLVHTAIAYLNGHKAHKRYTAGGEIATPYVDEHEDKGAGKEAELEEWEQASNLSGENNACQKESWGDTALLTHGHVAKWMAWKPGWLQAVQGLPCISLSASSVKAVMLANMSLYSVNKDAETTRIKHELESRKLLGLEVDELLHAERVLTDMQPMPNISM